MTTLALFDLDNTLLVGDSDHYWGEFLIKHGYVNEASHRATNDQFYQDYIKGCLNMDAYLNFALSPFINQPITALQNVTEQYALDVVKMIAPGTPTLLAHHRAQGHRLILITATNEFLVEPVARHLGISDIIAVNINVSENGTLLGGLKGTPSFQSGKTLRMQEWIKANEGSLDDAYFYSDSYNDIPLLSQVSHPIAVNPDSKLQAWAENNKAKIISLRD